MEAVVKQQLDSKTPQELLELTVEGIPCSKVEGLNESFSSLARLSVVNCGLKTLEGLPKLPKLTTLLLGDNKLFGEEHIETVVSCCPQLQSLSLVGNRFKSLDELKQLSKLEQLRGLDLFNCPVTSVEEYREKVFKMLPELKSLDGFDLNGKEVNPPGEDDDEEEEDEEEESDEEGPGLEYLQQEIADSDDEEEVDFDPEAEASPGSDDYVIEEDEEEEEREEEEEGGGPGPSKRARIDPPTSE